MYSAPVSAVVVLAETTASAVFALAEQNQQGNKHTETHKYEHQCFYLDNTSFAVKQTWLKVQCFSQT